MPVDNERYYLHLAAAFVRGKLPEYAGLTDEQAFQAGVRAGLRLHKFKRSSELPRVRKVLGILRGLVPENLLDIGSGRGVFLWPLLDAFPWLSVQAIDRNSQRVEDLQAVTKGGIATLSATVMDATGMDFPDRHMDVVTFLEVLEHIPEPSKALAEAVRVARRFVVVSVPSKEDDNPEHIHLFDRPSLEELFTTTGAKSVKFDGVLNHLIAVAKV